MIFEIMDLFLMTHFFVVFVKKCHSYSTLPNKHSDTDEDLGTHFYLSCHYDVIIIFLKCYQKIDISVETWKRRLKQCSVKKRCDNVTEEQLTLNYSELTWPSP